MRVIAYLALLLLSCADLSAQISVVKTQPRGGTPTAAEPSPTRPENQGTIQGIIVNQATGEAIKRAVITLRRTDRANASTPSAISESDGAFIVRNLDPGRYVMSATKNGFTNQIYGTRASNNDSASIFALSPGQTIKDIRFGLTPHGVVAGRVMDDDGEPMANISVKVLQSIFLNGTRQIVTLNQVTTNDLGAYRIFGLAAGRYYIQARFSFRNMMGQQADLAYQSAFYPNAPDITGASPLPIAAGQTTQGIDFTLRRCQAFRISGRVTDSGRVQDRSTVWLTAKASGVADWDRNATPVRNGKFEIRGVLPGTYTLGSDSYSTEGVRTSGLMTITVTNSNVDHIELASLPAVEISGRVVYEDEPEVPTNDANGVTTGTSQVTHAQNAFLMPKDEDSMGMGGTQGQVGEGRKFIIKNIVPVAYNVNMQLTTPGAYIKTIRLGDSDVTDQGVDFSSGASAGELTIVVSYASGTVDGTVENAKQEHPAGVQVVAVPELDKRSQQRLFKLTVTDRDGHFELKGLAPGEYQIFAFEEIEYGAYVDSELLKPISDKGQRVTIKAKSKESLNLRVVPAEATKVQQ